MEKFSLLKFEYVELYKLLKIQNWVASGGDAKQMVDEGLVKVNGEVETRRRKKIRVGDRVAFQDNEVSIEKREA